MAKKIYYMPTIYRSGEFVTKLMSQIHNNTEGNVLLCIKKISLSKIILTEKSLPANLKHVSDFQKKRQQFQFNA